MPTQTSLTTTQNNINLGSSMLFDEPSAMQLPLPVENIKRQKTSPDTTGNLMLKLSLNSHNGSAIIDPKNMPAITRQTLDPCFARLGLILGDDAAAFTKDGIKTSKMLAFKAR